MSREEEELREGQERPRPRVVDKRVSARPSEGAAREPTPPPAAPPPSPPPPDVRAVPAGAPPAPGPGGGPGEPEGGLWTPEQEEAAQRLAQQIAETPGRDWVLNAAVTLANVAAAKIELGMTEDASLAIDALAAVVESTGARLGTSEGALRQTLAQLQLAYAQSLAPGRPQG
jgi:hypothetical protein